ncbi:hypothetical protein [Paraburkholderia tropica]|uniref:hypothetical protein n=1 Tax=Paraburkholderia tropica TaxID=92647 RepID=UPI002ABDD71F|nr:hypothetical protein [Paraburkholderia tropica]
MKKISNIGGLLIFFLVTSAVLAVTDEIIREHTESFGAKIAFYAALIAATGMLWDLTKGVLTDELSVDVGRLAAMVIFGLGSIGAMKCGYPIVFGVGAIGCACTGVSVLRKIQTVRSAAEKVEAQAAQEKLIAAIDAVVSEAMQGEGGMQAKKLLAPTATLNAKRQSASTPQLKGLERMF